MIEVMEIDETELPRLLDVRNAVATRDPISVGGYVDWRRQAEDMAWFLALADGRDVGAGHALVGWHSPPGVAAVAAWTAPDARGRGVGQALYEELLEWATARGSMAVDTSVMEDDPASLGWAERRGFRRIGSTSFRTLDLRASAAPAVPVPSGITITTWAERPGIERALYDVYREAVPDIPGEEAAEVPSFERWLATDMLGSSDHREAVFVAVAGETVVGYAKLSYPHDHGGTAWHDLAAVRRAWRGQGIAAALKAAQIDWARAQGFARLTTQNEQRNEPVMRLNERLGYVVEPGRITLRTILSSPD